MYKEKLYAVRNLIKQYTLYFSYVQRKNDSAKVSKADIKLRIAD